MKEIDKYESIIPVIPHQKGITKIIHQTYRDKNYPKEIQDNINRLIKMNPDWEYKFYDNSDIEEFIKKNYGDIIYSYYNRIDPRYGAAKADLFRYLLIYKVGGVYLDLKSSIIKPLNSTIFDNDEYILSHWNNEQPGEFFEWGLYKELTHISKGEYQQWHIIASAGHPFLRHVIIRVLQKIDTYSPFREGISTIGVLRTTGPIIYSLAIEEVREKYPNKYRIVENNEFGLQYSIYKGWEHKKKINSFYNKGIAPIIMSDSILYTLKVLIFFRLKYILESMKNIGNIILGNKQKRI